MFIVFILDIKICIAKVIVKYLPFADISFYIIIRLKQFIQFIIDVLYDIHLVFWRYLIAHFTIISLILHYQAKLCATFQAYLPMSYR